MTSDQIVSGWKSEDYRLSLNVNEQALLPENPAGLIELSDQELLGMDGGSDSVAVCILVTLVLSGITLTPVATAKVCPGT